LPVNFLVKYDQVLIGNDVFVLGFPTSIGEDNYPQFDYEQPLVKKGIIAGKNKYKRTLILDCIVHFGNSGGPVIEVLKENGIFNSYKLIGIVTEFIPFVETWTNNKTNSKNTTITNSNYSVVSPCDGIFDLLETK
jgi:hypothetical protein